MFQHTADESYYKNCIETILSIANYRNKLQEEILEFFKTATNNGKKEVSDSDKLEFTAQGNLLSELTNNFLGAEFLNLSIDLLEISNDQRLSTNLQYQASEADMAVFKFSSQLVYRVPNYTELIYDDLAFYTKNYLLEVKEVIKALSSDCYAVREASLLCLENLNKEREGCLNKIDLSEKFLIGNYIKGQLY